MKKIFALLLCLALAASLTTALAAAPNLEEYTDVPADRPYAFCVRDVTQRGLMQGVGEQSFAPDSALTRAMLVTVLWRMNGALPPREEVPFSDVAKDQWYTDAVAWAAENNVVQGIGGGMFAPNAPVTREQMAAIFYRWAKGEGLDVSPWNYTDYAKTENASDWAAEAVDWAISRHLLAKRLETGLPHGDSGYFYNVPAGATRAEVAVFLSRYCLEYQDVSEGAGRDRVPASMQVTDIVTEHNTDHLLLLSQPDGLRHLAFRLNTPPKGNSSFQCWAYKGPVTTQPLFHDADKSLARTYTDDGQLASAGNFLAARYDSQGRVTELTYDILSTLPGKHTLTLRVTYAPWGDPLFLDYDLGDLWTDEQSGTYAFYYTWNDDGKAVLTAWGQDTGKLDWFQWPNA